MKCEKRYGDISIIFIAIYLFRQQSSFDIDQMQIDRANSTYVWEDWVTMVTRKKYNDLQTSIEPSLKYV